jgi:hypothetical protein
MPGTSKLTAVTMKLESGELNLHLSLNELVQYIISVRKFSQHQMLNKSLYTQNFITVV